MKARKLLPKKMAMAHWWIKKVAFDWRPHGYPSAVIYNKTVWKFLGIVWKIKLEKKK